MDDNGFIMIADNPISRSGIFQYLGASIDSNAIPDKIYNVYRPDSELADPACIDSFKLIPIVDDHTMVGANYTPAEEKGVHGSTGENVRFENNVLFSNLKIFSDTLANLIEQGKRHLSLGYKCVYEKSQGFFNNQSYDYIQRNLRGNHLALVDQSRCDVLVLDRKECFDYADINIDLKNISTSSQEPNMSITQEQLKATLDEALKPLNAKITAMDADMEAMKKDKESEDKKAADVAAEEKTKAELEAADKKAKDDAESEKADKAKGMDAAELKSVKDQLEAIKKDGVKTMITEIGARDNLVTRLSPHIGTFDAKEKTLGEVAKYGVEKLGLKCIEGQEMAALDGFLHNRPNPNEQKVISMDGKQASEGGAVAKYIKAGK